MERFSPKRELRHRLLEQNRDLIRGEARKQRRRHERQLPRGLPCDLRVIEHAQPALHAFIARWLTTEQRPGWAETRAAIDRVVAYLREFYLDFDECVEWSAPQWIERPACLAWFWAPVVRHGAEVPGCPGLWLASTTIESEAGPVDIGAHAGLEAARAILRS